MYNFASASPFVIDGFWSESRLISATAQASIRDLQEGEFIPALVREIFRFASFVDLHEAGYADLVLFNDLSSFRDMVIHRTRNNESSTEAQHAFAVLQSDLENLAASALSKAVTCYAEDLFSLAYSALGGRPALLQGRIQSIRQTWIQTLGTTVEPIFWECVVDPSLEPITTAALQSVNGDERKKLALLTNKICAFCEEQCADIHQMRNLATLRNIFTNE